MLPCGQVTELTLDDILQEVEETGYFEYYDEDGNLCVIGNK